jgi:long-chain acyl-CoA synthetase
VQPLVAQVRARQAIVEDAGQLAKLDAVRADLPCLERVWVIDDSKLPADHDIARPWSELLAAGREGLEAARPELEARVAALGRADLATIIFTSGTTGVPKGVMLTHGNFLANIEGLYGRIVIEQNDSLLIFLPQSHVFQRTVTYLGLDGGASCLFNESLRHLFSDLLLLRPTVMCVVPRLVETMRDRVLQNIAAKPGLHGFIAKWAMGVGDQLAAAYAAGRRPGAWLRLQRKLADQRVFSVIREQLGLDHINFMVSGGAALSPVVGRWFYGIGIKLFQGYGLTETSPVVAAHCSAGDYRFETIGPPINGVEVSLGPDGELLTRGDSNMKGYFEMPEETAAAIDAEGWFHTGDLAEIDPDGQLRITGRKKEIMVLANGKNVAPAPIEARLAESPLIDRVMVIGDGQNVVTALVVPSYDALHQHLEAGGGAPERDQANAWVACEAAASAVRAEIDRLQTILAPFEQVRRFRLLPRDFSLEHEEMTPTMKIRRPIIMARYAELVAEMAQ